MAHRSWARTASLLGIMAIGIMATGRTPAFGQTCSSGAPQPKSAPPTSISVHSLRVPEKAWKHFHNAVAASLAGHREEFARELAKALDTEPAFPEAYLLRASEAIEAGRFDAAIADVQIAQRMEPGAWWSGIILAEAYNGLRRYADAHLALASLHPAEWETWQAKYEMARTVTGLGDVAEALRWSAAALEAAPAACLDARLLRANAFLIGRRWTEAATELTIYLHSPLPQQHRAQAVQVLERVTRFANEEASRMTASAGGGQP